MSLMNTYLKPFLLSSALFLIGRAEAETMTFKIPATEGELNDLIASLHSEVLPKMQLAERCVRETNGLVLEYVELRKLYSQKSPSQLPLALNADLQPNATSLDVNIFRNFDAMSATNTDFFQKLSEFLNNELQNTPSEFPQIETSLSNLNKRLRTLEENLYPLAAKESQFLRLMSLSESALDLKFKQNRSTLAWLLGPSCQDAKVDWKIMVLQKDAVEMLRVIGSMRKYTLALRLKRTNIVQNIENIVRQRLENKWREKFTTEGQNTMDEINAILKTTQIGAELQEHWIVANMNGLGNGLHLKYLQYQEPLRLLMAELGRLKQFEARLDSIPNAPQDMLQSYHGILKTNQGVVKDSIQKLVAKGWKGQLDRQILLNKKRSETATGPCASALQEHLDFAAKTFTLQTFSTTEALYKKAIDLCATL